MNIWYEAYNDDLNYSIGFDRNYHMACKAARLESSKYTGEMITVYACRGTHDDFRRGGDPRKNGGQKRIRFVNGVAILGQGRYVAQLSETTPS